MLSYLFQLKIVALFKAPSLFFLMKTWLVEIQSMCLLIVMVNHGDQISGRAGSAPGPGRGGGGRGVNPCNPRNRRKKQQCLLALLPPYPVTTHFLTSLSLGVVSSKNAKRLAFNFYRFYSSTDGFNKRNF